jgi:phospholipid transport system substrate-binding protein
MIVAVLALALFVLPLQVLAATAKETVEVQVNKVLKTLAEPAFKDQPRDAKITKIRSIVNEIFDYTELSRRTLGREWSKFNPQQQNEFVKLFGDLLEKTYADRLLSYSNEKVVFEKESTLREDQVEVTSNIVTGDGKKIPLDYRLINKEGNWRVYDVTRGPAKNYRDSSATFWRRIPRRGTEELGRRYLKKAAGVASSLSLRRTYTPHATRFAP